MDTELVEELKQAGVESGADFVPETAETPEEPAAEETPTEEAQLEPGAEPEAELEPEGEPSEEKPTEETISIAGREYRPSDLAPIAELADWAQKNPQAWSDIERLYQEGIQAEPQKPVGEEEWVDPDTRIARLETQLSALTQERENYAKAEFVASLDDAIADFRREYPDLNDEDMNRVLRQVRDLGILPTFRGRYPARPVQATVEAFRVAYRNEFYDRAPARQPVTTSEIRARRKAASAVPVATSAPRTEPEPETPQERQEALVRDIKEALHA